MGRRINLLVRALTAILVGLFLPVVPALGNPFGTRNSAWIELVSGEAAVSCFDPAGKQIVDLGGGALIEPGSAVVTGSSGRVALRFGADRSIRLDHSSHLRMGDVASVTLKAGAVYVDTPPNSFVIHTLLGVSVETSTQMEVRLDDHEVVLRVRDGSAKLRWHDAIHVLASGTEARLHADGTWDEQALSAFGPEWAWVAQITPVVEFDGQSANDFFLWVAREQGRYPKYADESAALAARGVRITGSTARLTLDEALETVAAVCNLRARADRESLMILPVSEKP